MIETRRLALDHGPTVVALLAVQRAAYAVEASLAKTDAIPALHESPAQLAGSGESYLGAFGDGGRLVGAVAWKRHGATVDIHRLVVSPDAFRRGVASALLDALEAEEPDARRWLVATAAANAPGRALYARRGFAERARRVVAEGLQIVELERVAS